MRTVAELIAELQKMPPEAIVCIADWNEGYVEPLIDFPVEVHEQLKVFGGKLAPVVPLAVVFGGISDD